MTNAYKVDWGNENRTFIRIELSCDLSETAFHHMVCLIVKMGNSVTYPVDLLTIDRRYYFFNLQYLHLKQADYGVVPQTFRYMILVGTPTYAMIFATLLADLLPKVTFDGAVFFNEESKAIRFLQTAVSDN